MPTSDCWPATRRSPGSLGSTRLSAVAPYRGAARASHVALWCPELPLRGAWAPLHVSWALRDSNPDPWCLRPVALPVGLRARWSDRRGSNPHTLGGSQVCYPLTSRPRARSPLDHHKVAGVLPSVAPGNRTRPAALATPRHADRPAPRLEGRPGGEYQTPPGYVAGPSQSHPPDSNRDPRVTEPSCCR